jgi:hypothetical protein
MGHNDSDCISLTASKGNEKKKKTEKNYPAARRSHDFPLSHCGFISLDGVGVTHVKKILKCRRSQFLQLNSWLIFFFWRNKATLSSKSSK